MWDQIWQYLTTLSIEQVHLFLFWWVVFGFVCSVGIPLVGVMPLSGRADNTVLEFLGKINKRAGWIIMEAPILIVVAVVFLLGPQPLNPGTFMIGLFFAHYVNRALIFPYRIKVAGKTMPISMMLSTMAFYIINGFLVAYYFGWLISYPESWWSDPRFILGLALFLGGWFINVQSDNILIGLRGPGETGYKIPQGGFFRYVSCPNYLGECIEWTGFAIMSWNMMGLSYALWVVMPLVMQARVAHAWYREKFGDHYPATRKAIIPGVF